MKTQAQQLRDQVIRPVLVYLGMHSEAAENLLLGTAAQESHLGKYLTQLSGPALGLFQIEPFTHDDIHHTYLAFRPQLAKQVVTLTGTWPDRHAQLASNAGYAVAIARLKYYRIDEPLPAANDVEGLARYWKAHYNSPQGAGTVEEFVDNWHRYVA